MAMPQGKLRWLLEQLLIQEDLDGSVFALRISKNLFLWFSAKRGLFPFGTLGNKHIAF